MDDPNDRERPGPAERWGERRYTLGATARYAWHNRLKLIRDAVAALVIGLGAATIFGSLPLPTWTFYVALLLAFMLYNYLVSPWERPGDDED